MLDSRESYTNRDIKSIVAVPGWRLCLCGCRKAMPALDPQGRQRYYILGHNRRHKKKDKYSIEIDKIEDIEIAKDIIKRQAIIIEELQKE